MKPVNNVGIKRIIRATGFSLNGIKAAWINEAAFRQESVLALILLPLAMLMPVSVVEKILLCLTVLLVLIVELINSAIEAVVDRISSEQHPLSGQAKDTASAAVFLSLIVCGITWASILFPLVSAYL
ncbi:diacylglycerol kinase [Shewanella intestini]|uniref:Diacylglycerol kinase n=1 Tax=Shewanella intestini TaxID=2017544 RepID=A0ABS5I150_9GAMM|nr:MULTISPECIES: diacylglycerol kinase [Shewanella]MBR9727751.1 diacylglycerol kinase [Shewanella intestini]MRG36256.1 diacylglycerol kinase [Shewanella sp. XMDDZSB0408]